MTGNASESFALYSQRRQKAAQAVASAGASALLVSDLKNVRYLTGFTGSNGAVLLRANGEHVVATDSRYDTQIRIQTGSNDAAANDLTIVVSSNIYAALKEEAGEAGFHIEPGMSVGVAQKLAHNSDATDAAPDMPAVLSGVIEDLRLVKSAEEIDALRAAGKLADDVWQEFIADGGIREGISELDAAADLENRLRRAGADGLSFDTILASGVNGAKPHAGVSTDIIVPGLVTVDFGVYLNGYASDQTRTVCVGEPDELVHEIYDIVYQSQKAGEALLRAGAKLKDVDTACRKVIAKAGYGEYFIHSTGHGVGLDVHEEPRAAAQVPADAELREGMTLTVEPGIYLPGKTGLRIENTYVITADGAESLNPSPTEMRIV